jgi:excisionase family DNA binding protein
MKHHPTRSAVIDGPRFGTIEEAANYFAVSTRTIRRWASQGHIHLYRLGGRTTRVDLNEIATLAVRVPTADGA